MLQESSLFSSNALQSLFQEYKTKEEFAGNCFNVSTIVDGIPAEFDRDTLSTRLCGDQFQGEQRIDLPFAGIGCSFTNRFFLQFYPYSSRLLQRGPIRVSLFLCCQWRSRIDRSRSYSFPYVLIGKLRTYQGWVWANMITNCYNIKD